MESNAKNVHFVAIDEHIPDSHKGIKNIDLTKAIKLVQKGYPIEITLHDGNDACWYDFKDFVIQNISEKSKFRIRPSLMINDTVCSSEQEALEVLKVVSDQAVTAINHYFNN